MTSAPALACVARRKERERWGHRYHGPPRECLTCAAYSSTSSFDLYEDTDSSDETDSSGLPESSTECDLSSNRNTSKQVTTLDAYLTITDMQKLLEEQCPEEYATLPRITSLEFEDWEDGRAHKRICVGEIRTPFEPTGHAVYAYIYGNDNNRIGLTPGAESTVVPLKNAHHIKLDEPFRSICLFGRLTQDEEKKRLRALLCFWFSEAGQLPTPNKYSDCEKHLVEAVQWLGKAIIWNKKAKESQDGVLSENVQLGEADEQLNPRKRNRTSQLEQFHEDTRGCTSFPSKFIPVNADASSAKRTKLEHTVSAMRQRQNEQMADIATVEREIVALRDSARIQAEFDTKIIEQGQKITELESQLVDAKNAQLRYTSQRQRIEVLETQLQRMEEERGKEKETADENRTLRCEAERKLKEYIDAQKKMAAEFA